jgi:parvin
MKMLISNFVEFF